MLFAIAIQVFCALAYAVVAEKVWVVLGEGYRGLYNSAWIGALMAVCCSIFFSLAGFYVVKNSVQRDVDTRVGQILALLASELFHRFDPAHERAGKKQLVPPVPVRDEGRDVQPAPAPRATPVQLTPLEAAWRELLLVSGCRRTSADAEGTTVVVVRGGRRHVLRLLGFPDGGSS
jgi:hypothetical protein